MIRRQLRLSKDAKLGAFVLGEKLCVANDQVWAIGISHSFFLACWHLSFTCPILAFAANSKAHSYRCNCCNLHLQERASLSFVGGCLKRKLFSILFRSNLVARTHISNTNLFIYFAKSFFTIFYMPVPWNI